MPLLTTTLGAYPKPSFVEIQDWFNIPAGEQMADPTKGWNASIEAMGDRAEEILAKGTAEVISDQEEAGIDVVTDGEVRRENYIHYHCRRLEGFDFENLTTKSVRNDAYSVALPTIRSKVDARKSEVGFLVEDWKTAQALSNKPVKMTIPGPLTISDTTYDAFYGDLKTAGRDLAEAVNKEVRALVDAGCQQIQIDEPVFARRPQEALEFGIENLERAFHGVPKEVTRTTHMCCGYPDVIDNPDYPKADQQAYLDIATTMDMAAVDAISIEDAHRYNDLRLLEIYSKKTIIFGSIAIAKSRIETVDEVRDRLIKALDHIDAHRLMVAPDCGMGLLTREQARAKLAVMCEAARSLG
ncbi:cobalamin-independent methionine synthase II family protein [Alphaproteobacteria bacterium]|jgi:5-methyltetrahydropteroyltriglutamate--homocysteine methyltransferase|nr:cobalamin-independent methionine synthase II family protein [Alphaproteobacteria bacterium]